MLLSLDPQKDQVKQNKNLLTTLGLLASCSGLAIWFLSPLIPIKFSRYLSLIYPVGMGIICLDIAEKLKKPSKQAKKIEKAEDIVYDARLGSSVYAYEQLYESQARRINKTSEPIEAEVIEDELDAQILNPQVFLEEVTGVAVLGNSGSAKTQFVKWIVGHIPNPQIIVLDPHADREHPEYPWEDLMVINSYPLILEQLEMLLQLLDQRDRTNLVIVADEFPAIRAYAKKQKSAIADDFILRYGSEARKFNKLPIFCSQSGNTKACGLEGMGDFLENFALCRTGKVAIKYSRNLPDQSVHYYCKSVAYPLLIGDVPYVHPTHGHYAAVKKGNKPANLKPLISQPLTIPLVGQKQPITIEKQAEPFNYYDAEFDCPDIDLNQVLGNFGDYQQETNGRPQSCPECGGEVKGNGTYKGVKRWRCKSCNNTKF